MATKGGLSLATDHEPTPQPLFSSASISRTVMAKLYSILKTVHSVYCLALPGCGQYSCLPRTCAEESCQEKRAEFGTEIFATPGDDQVPSFAFTVELNAQILCTEKRSLACPRSSFKSPWMDLSLRHIWKGRETGSIQRMGNLNISHLP